MKDLKLFITYALFALCLIGVCVWGITQDYKYGGNPNTKVEEMVSIGVEINPIDLLLQVHETGKDTICFENIMDLMFDLGIEHPHIVYAQMRLESGNFKSDLAKSNNNFFGMKQPRTRATASLGEKNGYAIYKSWSYSVLDYAIWQRRYAKGLSEEGYLEILSDRYAEDKKYVSKVTNIADSVKNKINNFYDSI